MIFDEKATQSVVKGLVDVGELSEAIAVALAAIPGVNAIAAVLAAVIAAAMFLEKLAIDIADKGKGIHFNLYWPNIPVIVSSSPLAALAHLIPLPNK